MLVCNAMRSQECNEFTWVMIASCLESFTFFPILHLTTKNRSMTTQKIQNEVDVAAVVEQNILEIIIMSWGPPASLYSAPRLNVTQNNTSKTDFPRRRRCQAEGIRSRKQFFWFCSTSPCPLWTSIQTWQ